MDKAIEWILKKNASSTRQKPPAWVLEACEERDFDKIRLWIQTTNMTLPKKVKQCL